jgi:methanogenic corrinoid protein MtbC1
VSGQWVVYVTWGLTQNRVWPLKPVHDLVQLAQSQVCSVVMAATVMGSSMALTSDSTMATDSEGVVIYVVVAGVVVADVVGAWI